ncbi:MAG: hypothetical protein FJ217_15040 [Ignavibacteria bacterium]|nr:hypothetical protein [Ignavibacteria bacterium]
MDCRSFQEHLGDAIDRFLPQSVEQEFQAHLDLCRKCRDEFELERLCKQVVQRKIKRVGTPPATQALVLHSLQEQYAKASSSAEGWWDRLFTRRALVPAIASGLAVVVFVLFLTVQRDPSEALTDHSASNDLINQSFKNFALVRSGELKPDFVASCPESVASYFKKSSIDFAVHVVRMPDCEWYGAMAVEHAGVKMAHVAYRTGDDWMFVCEARHDAVMQSASLSLPPAAKRALTASNWYIDPAHPECNVVMWITDGVLCTAVSTMKKEKLLAVLTTR